MVREGAAQWVELREAGPAEGEGAVAAGLEARAGRVTVTDVTRGGLALPRSFLLETENDVGQGGVLWQPVDASWTCVCMEMF